MEKKQIINYSAAVLFCAAFPYLLGWMRSRPLFNLPALLFSIACVLTAVITISLFRKVLIYNSDKSAAQLKRQLVPSYFLIVFITVFAALSIYSLASYLSSLTYGWDTAYFLKHLVRYELPGAVICVFVGVFLETIAFFLTVWRQAIGREQQSEEEALKYKYRNLKAQVNPHFLFNSLNTLSEIVYVDAKKADSYIQKLAGIYRYILEHEETDQVTLSEELEYVSSYFDLQKERDGNKIRLDISVDDTSKFKIIPVSLQILVENALKHNSASEENPLDISIYKEGEAYIVVSNPIRKRTTMTGSHGTGLVNLKERVKQITGKEMIVQTDNNQFTVKLPIIKQ